MKNTLPALLAALIPAFLQPACDGEQATKPVEGPLVVEDEHATLVIGTDPFSLALTDASGEELFTTVTEARRAGDAALTYGVFDALEPTHFYNPGHTEAQGSDTRWVPRWQPAGIVTEAVELEDGWRLGVQVDEEVASALTVTVRSEPDVGFSVELELSEPRAVAFTRFGIELPGDEHLYGLGERFDRTDARGGAYEMFMALGNLDSGLNEVHVPVPFYVSNRGYGLFWEDPHPSFFDLGADADDRVRVTYNTGEPMVLHVITGGDPLAVAARYGRLTGPAALPPLWAFAPLQWRNELDDRAMLLEDARAIRDNDIPGSCIWIDNPWQTAYNTHLFNEVQFPDPETMLAELEALGFRNMVWSTPYLDYTDDRWWEGMEPDTRGLFEEAEQAGYFVLTARGEPFYLPWNGSRSGGRIDFTNPDANAFWQDVVSRVTTMGVVGFKLDYGESMVPGSVLDAALDLRFADGRTTLEMHKLYSVLYHRAYREQALADNDEAFILGRSSTYGGQRHCEAIWPGDMDASFLEHREETEDGSLAVGGLPAVIAAVQNLSVSGFPAFGSDTGGYRGDEQDKELLVRWAQHTALTPIMQLGGGDHHNVWDFTVYDEQTLEIYRRYARLHTRLVPLFYSLAVRASEEGIPPIRPLGLVWPEDEAAHAAFDEYMVGDQLLVAPVRERGATRRTVYLPRGRWVHWFTGEVYEGPAEHDVAAALDELPLFMAPGAVVAMIADDVDTFVSTTRDELVTLEERREQLFVRVLPAGDSAFELFDGGAVTVSEDGASLSVEVSQGSWFERWVLEVEWDERGGADGRPPESVSREGVTLSEHADPSVVAAGGCDGCYHHVEATGVLIVSLASEGTVVAE
jgi:alpha-D-xyloside xylohydrolase